MRPVSATAIVVWLMLGPAVWPAGAANREHEQLMADIRMLQEQTQQLQLLLGALSESIKAVNSRLDEQAAADRRAFADHKLLVDTLSGDVRVVREKVDETNVRLASLTQDVEGLRQMIPPPGTSMIAPDPADPSSAPGGEATDPAEGSPPPPTGPAAVGMSPRQLFEQAFADYAGGQWSIAISGFEMYLKTYPRSELADDAQYYIGESYSGASNHKDALAAYQRVLAEHPNGDKAPDAAYKLGLSHERLGQRDRAREAYQQVTKQFPESDAAALARQAIERLNRQR